MGRFKFRLRPTFGSIKLSGDKKYSLPTLLYRFGHFDAPLYTLSKV